MIRLDLIAVALICTPSLLFLSGCGVPAQPTPTPPSLERLIAILEASDPALPGWEHTDFAFATSELARMGPAAAPAAPALARALQYPRRDSYEAGKALVAIGPAGAPAVPELVKALRNDRPEVRSIAAYVLGIIGEQARCAVPEIAPLLWDSDMFARGAAAEALDAITGRDLVEWIYKIDPSRPMSISGDKPDGSITGKARTWWTEEGQYLDWLDESGLCNPGSP